MSEKFILQTKATKIIEEALIATNCLSDDLSSLPVVNYICSSIFLKLTGLLEQKFKALAWTLANDNREYRRKFISENYGEYSSYNDKQKIYKQLIMDIFRFSKDDITIRHKELAKEAQSFIKESFKNTIFATNLCRDFCEFDDEIKMMNFSNITVKFSEDEKGKDIKLINDDKMKELFNNIINERNRIAHNTFINKPEKMDIKELYNINRNSNLNFYNVFIQFFMLIYIDNIFNTIYEMYETYILADNFDI